MNLFPCMSLSISLAYQLIKHAAWGFRQPKCLSVYLLSTKFNFLVVLFTLYKPNNQRPCKPIRFCHSSNLSVCRSHGVNNPHHNYIHGVIYGGGQKWISLVRVFRTQISTFFARWPPCWGFFFAQWPPGIRGNAGHPTSSIYTKSTGGGGAQLSNRSGDNGEEVMNGGLCYKIMWASDATS